MAVTAPHRRAPHTAVGRVVAVEPDGPGSVLVVDSRGVRGSVLVPARPDPALARRLTGGLRRIHWVRIACTAVGTTCEVTGSSHRSPVQRRIPLAAGLALTADGVPTVITSPDLGTS